MGQMNNPGEIKRKIVGILRLRGPSLPVNIARETETNSLFAGAFLSELAKEKEIKISNLKVGGSPLYFLEGQEYQLEKFHTYLLEKERETFLLLRQKKILEDSKQQPAIRVALRNLKDFAFPFIEKTKDGQQIYWRFYSFGEKDAREKIKPGIPEKKPEIIIKALEQTKKIPATEPKKEKKKSEFVMKITSLLQAGNLEIIEELEQKKRDFAGIIRINSEIGKLKLLCLAKDKKTITENDVGIAVQKSQSLKMPALLLSTGDLNKKALSYLEQYSGLIKFKRIQEQ